MLGKKMPYLLSADIGFGTETAYAETLKSITEIAKMLFFWHKTNGRRVVEEGNRVSYTFP